MSDIKIITMPKWGMAMEEGVVARWAVSESDTIVQGQEVMDIETSKIANIYESPVGGILRRRLAGEGDVLPVGALLAVIADSDVSEAKIDAFIADFNAKSDAVSHKSSSGPVPDTLEIGGKRITYLRVGPEAGEPVVFVHGFGSDHKAWLLNQAAIAETHPTYALDLPGHGASYKDAADFSARALAGVLGAFLDELRLADVHLVGHSLGAAVSILAAAAHPQTVKSLTLIAPAGLSGDIAGPFLDGFVNESRARKLRPFIEMLVADPRMVTSEMVEDVLKFKRLDGAQEALEAVRAANFPGSAQTVSVHEALAALTIPVQVILGANDNIVAGGRQARPSNATYVEIAGAGHIPHLERAAEVNDHIKCFADRRPST